jgi:hypothetical protein
VQNPSWVHLKAQAVKILLAAGFSVKEEIRFAKGAIILLLQRAQAGIFN